MTQGRRVYPAPITASLLLAMAPGCRSDPPTQESPPDRGWSPRPGDGEGEHTGPLPAVRGECDPEIRVPDQLGRQATPHADVLGDDPIPEHVRIGWPSSDPSTSASFVWGTDDATHATVVEYRADGESPRFAYGASYRFGSRSGNPGPDRVHEVKICRGLTPDTTYRYRVGGDGAWSRTYSFTTPGAPGTFDRFRVAMTGDARGGFEVWSQILARIDAEDPDFILFSGDFVNDGHDEGEWDELLDASRDVLARRVLIPAHGNHEQLASGYFARFSLPNNEQWFTFLYGDLQVVVLNDTVFDWDDIHLQAGYVDQVFGASRAPWRVVMHHRTAFSSADHHGSADDLQSLWVPRFERNEVDLVLAGHDHVYERTAAIRDHRRVNPGEGPVYITSGGAGADLYGFDGREWFSDVAIATEHYILADFGPNGIHAVVRDLSGNTIDTFFLPR